jgi:hypothetical protein
MVKHTYASFAKVLSLILTTWFEILFSIALILSFIYSSTREYKVWFSVTIISLFVFQYIIIESICYIFGKFGTNTIKISQNVIETNNVKILADETRILYSKISIRNIFEFCPGEFVAINNGNEVKLGWYTRKEIKKISKYIQNIKYV